MLVKGDRKLTIRSAELLAGALRLKGRQKSLLLAFARLDSGRTEGERAKAREDIMRIKSRRPEAVLAAKQYSFLATWYYPVIFSLLQNLPPETTSQQIATALGRGVSVDQVERAFEDLSLLGLIEKNAEGAWRPVDAAVSTPDEIRELAVRQYHKNSIDLAERALALPLDRREFNGLTVTIPKKMLPAVKEKIRRLRTELNEMLAQETSAADAYQINMHLFPLTQGIERNEK